MRLIRTMFILAVVVTLLAIGAMPAQANQIEVKFTATKFAGYNGPAPTDPVSGTIIYEAASPKADIEALISINMMINEHSYSLSEVGFRSLPKYYEIYGLVNRTGIITFPIPGWTKNDFDLGWMKDSLTPTGFTYSSALIDGCAWNTQAFSSFTVTDISAVPETTTMVFLVAGLFGFVIFGREKLF